MLVDVCSDKHLLHLVLITRCNNQQTNICKHIVIIKKKKSNCYLSICVTHTTGMLTTELTKGALEVNPVCCSTLPYNQVVDLHTVWHVNLNVKRLSRPAYASSPHTPPHMEPCLARSSYPTLILTPLSARPSPLCHIFDRGSE